MPTMTSVSGRIINPMVSVSFVMAHVLPQSERVPYATSGFSANLRWNSVELRGFAPRHRAPL